MPENTPYNEPELLQQIANGDQHAFTQLYERYELKVLYIAGSILKSDGDADDILQNVFTRLWLNRSGLPEIRQFPFYLNTMVRNEVIAFLRLRGRATSLIRAYSLLSPPSGSETEEDFEGRQKKLKEAMDSLPPQRRKIFELCGLDGLAQKEVAQKLGLSTQTVKAHMRDALKSVRQFLNSAAKFFF